MKIAYRVQLLSVLLLPLVVAPFAAGQTLPVAVVPIETLNSSAGVVFSGTVIQIERAISADAIPAYVRVKFRVDEAVRGCNTGDTVTLDEWAELWERGDRYRRGQRVILFLYPSSQTGFSSPVTGDVGILLGPDGLLRATPQQAQTFASQATNSQPEASPTHGKSNSRLRSRLRDSSGQLEMASHGEADE